MLSDLYRISQMVCKPTGLEGKENMLVTLKTTDNEENVTKTLFDRPNTMPSPGVW